jgi:hypothetical protein
MNLGELRDLARTKLDDKVEPYLWSDEFLNDSINRAQDEAIVRMGGIGDDYTAKYVQGVVLAGFPIFVLSHSVLKVEQVRTNTRVLQGTTASSLSQVNPLWEAAVGVPTHFILLDSSIRLYPIPEIDTPISLSVRRGALQTLASDNQVSEVPFTLHHLLLHWVLHEAYMIPDSDISNPTAVETHIKAFDGIFGPRQSARFAQVWQRTPARTAALMRRM